MDLFLPVELLVALMLLLLSQTACVLLVAGGLHLEPARVLNEDMDVLFVFHLDLLAWLHLLAFVVAWPITKVLLSVVYELGKMLVPPVDLVRIYCRKDV